MNIQTAAGSAVRPGRSLTFRMRIRIALIVLILVAVSVTGIGSYRVAADIVERHAVDSGRESLVKSVQVLDNDLRRIAISVMTLMISDAFKDVMRDVSLGNTTRYGAHMTALQTLFAQMKQIEPMTHTVLVSTPIGEFYNTGYARDPSAPFIGSDIHRILVEEQGTTWIAGHRDPFFTAHENVVSLVLEPITDQNVKDVYILVNISERDLMESVEANMGARTSGDLLLLDDEGREVLRFGKTLPENTDDYIITSSRLSTKEDWTLYSVQPKSELFREMDRIQWIMLGVIAAGIVTAYLVSNVLMMLITRPLNNLMSLMRRVEANDLSVRFQIRHNDEFSRVGMRFNLMLEQIQSLIETVKAVEKEKSKAEQKALQAHISPHFLYNALNTIYFKCQLGQNEHVSEMVLALSRMFQLGLNRGSAITTVEKEIEHVKQYLLIQERSYPGVFCCSIELDDETLLDEPIPKIMLQPLVENAILHGFRDRRSGGEIRLSFAREGQAIRILVEDNGIGFDAGEAMAAIRRGDAAPREKSGYALFNVYHRLKLYYGDRADMTIDSRPGEGTRVSLLVPLDMGVPRIE
jgi:two-component system sensor histidine kinase YesM